MDEAVAFNNAGCALLNAGFRDIGKDMFRAALENISHDWIQPNLHNNQQQHERNLPLPRIAPVIPRCVTPDCVPDVTTAENPLHSTDQYLISASRSSNESSSRRVEMEIDSHNVKSIASSNMPQPNAQASKAIKPGVFNQDSSNKSGSYLYVCLKPIEIPVENKPRLEVMGAITVFNLAISHHLADSQCIRAGGFYEVTQRILNILPTHFQQGGNHLSLILLRALLLNNYAAWSHEIGQIERSQALLLQLIRLMESHSAFLPVDVVDGIRRNIPILLAFAQSARKTH